MPDLSAATAMRNFQAADDAWQCALENAFIAGAKHMRDALAGAATDKA